MNSPKYFEAPVAGEQIRELFAYKGEQTPLSEEDAAQLAQFFNEVALAAHGEAVWVNPESDGRELKIHGDKVELGGHALHAVAGEVAVFPPRSRTRLSA